MTATRQKPKRKKGGKRKPLATIWEVPDPLWERVLPILVGLTMWAQQKMNSAPMDPTQQKIFAWMPWILMFIMAPFAAGFQVYWVTNNLISILQIWFLNRKMGMSTPPAAVALAAPAPATAPPKPATAKGRQRPRKK